MVISPTNEGTQIPSAETRVENALLRISDRKSLHPCSIDRLRETCWLPVRLVTSDVRGCQAGLDKTVEQLRPTPSFDRWIKICKRLVKVSTQTGKKILIISNNN